MDDDTTSREYAERLQRREGARWKQILDVQAPYRWNLRRHGPGFTLDLGCGIGRNLAALDGVGVDHNEAAVEIARSRGLVAFTPPEFRQSEFAVPGRFDTMLLAHVVEHMTHAEASELIGAYVEYVKPGGRVILITPQEAGFRSDPTHVEFADDAACAALLTANGVAVERGYSFPLFRPVGRFLRYNEFVTLGRVQ